MTKRDLVIRISNETGLVQQQVLDVVQKTLDYIAEAVSKGRQRMELRNFGVFEVKVRKARIGRNPNAPATGRAHSAKRGGQVQAWQEKCAPKSSNLRRNKSRRPRRTETPPAHA